MLCSLLNSNILENCFSYLLDWNYYFSDVRFYSMNIYNTLITCSQIIGQKVHISFREDFRTVHQSQNISVIAQVYFQMNCNITKLLFFAFMVTVACIEHCRRVSSLHISLINWFTQSTTGFSVLFLNSVITV